jgi:predicted chitinase
MSEQGTRFKTGFLAPNIDYGAIGQGVAASFANPILAVAQERAAQRDAKMKALNPQAAAGEAVPGQINQKYQGAAQMALDIYQEAATNFELDPSGANEAAFVQAKNQYLSIIQDAKFGTEFIAKKTAEIKGNTELAESGLLDANINAITEYAMPPIYTRQGNVVMVGQGANAIDYFNSGITASNADNLFYETGSIVGDYKFLGSAVGADVFNSQIAPKANLSTAEGGYYKTQVVGNQAVKVGFDEENFSEDLANQYNVFASNNKTMWNAASLEGYKSLHAVNRDLQSGDLKSINNTMHPELFTVTDKNGVSISEVTGFEADGTPIYAVEIESVDDLKNVPTGITLNDIKKFREGETIHARNYYNTISAQFPRPDEDAVQEMLSQDMSGTGETMTRTIFTAYDGERPAADPTLTSEYPNMSVGSVASGGNFKPVTVSNVTINVEKAIIDLSTGQVIGYKIAKDQELIDKLQGMENRTSDQNALLGLLSEEADIYVNAETDSDAFNNIQQQLQGQQAVGKSLNYNILIGQAINELGVSIQDQAEDDNERDVEVVNDIVGMNNGGAVPGGDSEQQDQTTTEPQADSTQDETVEEEPLEMLVEEDSEPIIDTGFSNVTFDADTSRFQVNVPDAIVGSEDATLANVLKDESDVYVAAVEAGSMKEGLGDRETIEKGNYSSVKRIKEVFGSSIKKLGLKRRDLKQLVNNPEGIFNTFYGNENKPFLGNTEEGDGFKFRGRGYLQITGRANYAKISEQLFGDDRLVQNPDLILTPEYAEQATAQFLKNNKSRIIKKLNSFGYDIDEENLSQADANLLVASQLSGGKDPLSYAIGIEGLKKMDEATGVEREYPNLKS